MFWEYMSQINLFLQSLGDWLYYPMRLFSYLGDEEFYLFIMPAIYWCFNSLLGFRLGMLLMASAGINGLLKLAFTAPRPFWIDNRIIPYVRETSFGAPSGHAQNAVAIWGYLATIAKKKWVKWLFVLIIFFIGLSRIYLGAHFVLDVVSGWAAGILIVGFIIWIERRYGKTISSWTKSKKIMIATAISIVFILIAVILSNLNAEWQLTASQTENIERIFEGREFNPLSINGVITAAATWLGLVTGVVFTCQKIPLGVIKGDIQKKLLRFLIGLIGVMFLWGGLKFLFPDDIGFLSDILRFIRYFLVGLWISGGAPLVFKKLNL